MLLEDHFRPELSEWDAGSAEDWFDNQNRAATYAIKMLSTQKIQIASASRYSQNCICGMFGSVRSSYLLQSRIINEPFETFIRKTFLEVINDIY